MNKNAAENLPHFYQLNARNQLITSKKAAGCIVMAGDSLVVVKSPKNWKIADRRIEMETNAMKCLLVAKVLKGTYPVQTHIQCLCLHKATEHKRNKLPKKNQDNIAKPNPSYSNLQEV